MALQTRRLSTVTHMHSTHTTNAYTAYTISSQLDLRLHCFELA